MLYLFLCLNCIACSLPCYTVGGLKPFFFSDEGYDYVLELFDLQADPNERKNLATDPAYRQQLQQLQSWARQLALEMVSHFKGTVTQGLLQP
jgi:hypothetical protein